MADLPLPDEGLAHPLGAWRTWLAEHGSGLVPIAEPVRFQWPGWWIAVVEQQTGADLPLRAAHAVASLDPVPHRQPAGAKLRGTVEGLAVAPAAEVLDELGTAGRTLDFAGTRRNVPTRGVDVNALVGRRFRIGDVLCEGRRLCEPCFHLDRLSGPGLLRPLIHRGGLRADVLTDGEIRLGAPVVSL